MHVPAIVLFPTPPFPLATMTIFPTFATFLFAGGPLLGSEGGVPVRGRPFQKHGLEYFEKKNKQWFISLTKGFSCLTTPHE